MKFSATLACAALLSLGGMLAAAPSASAMPAVPLASTPSSSLLLDVRGGCAPDRHHDHWGRCVPNFYPHGRPFYKWHPRHYRRW